MVATAPFSEIVEGEILPGSQTQSDEDLYNFIRIMFKPNIIPSSSCSMLPLEQVSLPLYFLIVPV